MALENLGFYINIPLQILHTTIEQSHMSVNHLDNGYLHDLCCFLLCRFRNEGSNT